MKKTISICMWVLGGTFFVFSFCILFLCLFTLPKPVTFKIARLLFSILIKIMGIRLKIVGRDHIDPDHTYLIMGNHQSLFDLFVIPSAIPLCFTGIEASYHFSIPFWGFLIKKWGVIPIDRNHLKNAMESLDMAKKTLSSGLSIAVLPEGHRTLTGKIGPFKKGPFHLAKNARADILPFGINGLYNYNRKGALLLAPGTVEVTIGKPLLYEDYKECSVEQLKDMVFEKIVTLSRENESMDG